MSENKIKLTLQHNFSQDEMLQLSKELAIANQEMDRLDEQRKSVTSDFKAKIDHQKSVIGVYSSKVNNGYEFRIVECEVEYHKPKKGNKTISRLDTGESWVETMDNADYNLFNQENED